jgi:hypothetical protein
MRKPDKLLLDETDESKHGHIWPRIVGAVLIGSAAIGITVKIAKSHANKKQGLNESSTDSPTAEDNEETANFIPSKYAFTWSRDDPNHLKPHSAAGEMISQDGTTQSVRLQINHNPDNPSAEFIVEPKDKL